MTDIKKPIIVPEHVEERLVKKLCDVCREDVDPVGHYDVDEVTIERKLGTCYPGYNTGERTHFDICGKCFELKVVPFLQSLGMLSFKEDYD